ncbi:MAG: hypothetical protein ACTS9Y_08635 [Methylophilus sp.]|uniref:hypothetical protein n=1 Tax=Methylophilus sp. TaxID=29541 RepID=UPI003FA015DC
MRLIVSALCHGSDLTIKEIHISSVISQMTRADFSPLASIANLSGYFHPVNVKFSQKIATIEYETSSQCALFKFGGFAATNTVISDIESGPYQIIGHGN